MALATASTTLVPETLMEVYAVGGMHCGSCPQHVERALTGVPGVQSARVDFGTALVTVQRAATSTTADLVAAVADAGYVLSPPVQRPGTAIPLRPLFWGLLAAMALLAFYVGVLTLAQGWAHARQQIVDDRWFVAAITLGFATQVGLFTYLRGMSAQAARSGVAVSTGTSTTAMLACCAHHLVDILPIIGISGAAIFLNAYRTPLLWLGVVMNLMGVGYLVYKIREQRRMACHISV